jgi:hypothetical protein
VRAQNVIDLDILGPGRSERVAGEERIDDETRPGGLDEEAGVTEVREFHGATWVKREGLIRHRRH